MHSTSTPDGDPGTASVQARRAHLFALARATTGFMPDD